MLAFKQLLAFFKVRCSIPGEQGEQSHLPVAQRHPEPVLGEERDLRLQGLQPKVLYHSEGKAQFLQKPLKSSVIYIIKVFSSEMTPQELLVNETTIWSISYDHQLQS
jgi:hypothetical protein